MSADASTAHRLATLLGEDFPSLVAGWADTEEIVYADFGPLGGHRTLFLGWPDTSGRAPSRMAMGPWLVSSRGVYAGVVSKKGLFSTVRDMRLIPHEVIHGCLREVDPLGDGVVIRSATLQDPQGRVLLKLASYTQSTDERLAAAVEALGFTPNPQMGF